ncbi:Uma2 family endonuclease [Streptomyces flavofungini]|uniref:Uma2 family endonuclease n=1 Tax=Streptomyces flavofungini TaxID=68200 RepID=UPI0025AED763|nr:Uma2 family endonuclease [Streptomyces flavofungini]WJV47250.1 Uma2 family endonuclease [Streptomyces flavofungini]
MTPRTTDRPQMSIEDFEELARCAPETVRLEFINGKVQVKPVPDGSHGQIVMWLIKYCMQRRPELSLFPEQGLKVKGYRKGRAIPDGVLAPDENFVGQGQWADPAGVLMAVEVTSCDRDADSRDRVEKPDAYAATGIPVYLLVDRENNEVRVYADLKDGTYRRVTRRSFGDSVELPGPVGITLDTEKLKEYVD